MNAAEARIKAKKALKIKTNNQLENFRLYIEKAVDEGLFSVNLYEEDLILGAREQLRKDGYEICEGLF